MATIKPIDVRTVHQIQSGQVIVDLCSVVKELVENSVDAGATSIDVRFRNQGLDLIEVQDNGSGIAADNYSAVALKHHTSKLSSYSDISSLQTFGFRGEALASLCALSNLSVTTCQAADVPKGSKLTFKPSGQLDGVSVVAAQKGTTVSVEKLFHNLPVRRRELERNIKREWHKVIALLNQYACIQTNLKFTVSQQPTKGKRILLFSTKGNPTTRENIINIFGAKTLTALVPLDMKLELQPSSVNRNFQVSLPDPNASNEVQIVGYVSRPLRGEGRQTPDRQMFFINGRPCGLPQFTKTFNEVYRSYNGSQAPFILADIRLDTHMYDVNVSPDKRSILLHDQNDLLDNLRNSLTELFDSQEYTVPAAQLLKKQHADQAKNVPDRRRPSLDASERTGSGSSSESEPDEHASAQQSLNRGRVTRVAASRSLSRDSPGQNLISGWVERSTKPRQEDPRRSVSPVSITTVRRGLNPNSIMSSLELYKSGSLDDQEREDDDKPRPVRDFNRRLQENSLAPLVMSTGAGRVSPSSSSNESDEEEPPIPSVLIKRSEGISQSRLGTNLRSPSSRQSRGMGDTTIVIRDEHLSSPAASPTKTPLRQRSSLANQTGLTQSKFGSRLSQFSAGQLGGHPGDKTRSNETESEASQEPQETSDVEENSEEAPGEVDGSAREDNSSESLFVTDDVAEEAAVEDEAIEEHEEEPRHQRHGPGSHQKDAVLHVVQDVQASEEHIRSRMKEWQGRLAESNEVADEGDDEDTAMDASVDSEVESAVPEEKPTDPRPQAFKPEPRKKNATLQLEQNVRASEEDIRSWMNDWQGSLTKSKTALDSDKTVDDLGASDAEEKLSLIISKGDFLKMRIAGQFNLGFIIAVRPAASQGQGDESTKDDELFIIDQHATDEKYNFERLQATTVVQSQRLVVPKRLELTALEEEIVLQNIPAIEANGFKVHVDMSGDEPVGSRCQILSLPLSRETTFTLSDFEELVALLGEESSESKHIPRPSKVRKMFAMRACRSSIMIGKALTKGQMETLVRHMSDLDKPWNCPHGRPTMRHLCKLQPWDASGWKDDTSNVSASTWSLYVESD